MLGYERLLQHRLWRAIVGVILFGLIIGAGLSEASESTAITVQIAPICRYRIENSRIRRSDNSGKLIQETEIAVLSNSERPWVLVLSSGRNAAGLEWSSDGLNWDEVGENTVILSGTRSFWKRHFVYFRQTEAGVPHTGFMNYQILFEG